MNSEAETLGDRRSIPRAAFVLAVLSVAIGLYWAKRDEFQLGVYTDDAEYVLLAQSLSNRLQYRVTLSPEFDAFSKYPVGWPLVVSWFGDALDWRPDRLPSIAGTLTVLSVTLFMFSGCALGFPRSRDALIAGTLFAWSPMAVSHSAMVMSEPAYLFTSLLALGALYRASRADGAFHGAAVLCGGLIAFATFVRTIGIALVVAAVLSLVLNTRLRVRDRAIRLVGMMVGSAALSLLIVTSTSVAWTDLFGGAGVYTREYGEASNIERVSDRSSSLVERGVNGVAEYFVAHVRDALVPFIGSPSVLAFLYRLQLGGIAPLSGILITALVVVGMIVSGRAGRELACLFYVVAFGAIIVVWPWRGVRFLYPIAPMLFAYLVIGTRAVVGWIANATNARHMALPVVSILIGGLCLVQVARSIRITDSRLHVVDLRLGTEWIQANARADSLVLSEEPLTSVAIYARQPLAPLRNRCGAAPPCDLQGAEFVLVRPTVEWLPPGRHRLSDLGQAFTTWADAHPDVVSREFHDAAKSVSVYRLLDP